MKKNFIFILGLILTLVGFVPARASTGSGAHYLQSQQASDGTIGGASLTAWAAMALQVSGQPNNAVIQSLQSTQTSLSTKPATDVERQILALVATGQNPRTFAGVDAVTELEKRETASQIGAINQVNDDIFGILALRAAGESVPTGIINGLVGQQNKDGGWGIYTQSSSSSDMTAVALVALKPWLSDSVKTKADTYLHGLQNDDGGFATQSGTSNTSSTAWVTWWVNTSGENWSKNGHSPSDFLWSQQAGDGSWDESVLSTSYALLAVSGRSWPIVTTPVVTPPPTPVPTPVSTPKPTPKPTVIPTPVVTPTPSSSPTVAPVVNPVGSASPSPGPSSSSPNPKALDIPANSPSVTKSTTSPFPSASASPSALLKPLNLVTQLFSGRKTSPSQLSASPKPVTTSSPNSDVFPYISGLGIALMAYGSIQTVRDLITFS